MNKQKGIIIGVLALVVTMMVGYAIFSETITINGTATAKGEFDMTAACTTGLDPKLGAVSSLGLEPEHGYKNDSCTVSGNTVSLNLELEYPGATRYFTVKMINVGTIDSVINLEQDVTLTGKACVDGASKNESTENNGQIEEENECYDFEKDDIGSALNMYQPVFYLFEKADGTILDMNSDLTGFVDESTGNITLKPGQSMYFIFGGFIPEYVGKNSFLVTTDASYNFNWKQRTN